MAGKAKNQNILLEIGVEEMPSEAVNLAEAALAQSAPQALRSRSIAFGKVHVMSTPRRLAVIWEDVQEKGEDRVLEIKGPPVKAAFKKADDLLADHAGALRSLQSYEPTAAFDGFVRSQSAKPNDVCVQENGGSLYLYVSKHVAGTETKRLLPEVFTELIEGIRFKKLMGFDKGFRFVRPVRWLLGIYGGSPVAFSVGDVSAGKTSFGHRFFHPGPVKIEKADKKTYLSALKKASVIGERSERRRMILDEMALSEKKHKLKAAINEDVLEEVVDLVEMPNVIVGSFEKELLTLPRHVIVKVMESHQRYFPCDDASSGKLSSSFMIVHNASHKTDALIQKGHERVIRARLADGKFFYDADLARPLDELLEKLDHMLYQDKLGTLADKASRTAALASYITQALGAGTKVKDDPLIGAFVMKADLASEMVYEFPELQGLMGEDYAARSWTKRGDIAESQILTDRLGRAPKVSAPKDLAKAVSEHYLPKFNGDKLPKTMTGTVLSVADKIDTVVGILGIGLKPTGSEDPYGLRRQAAGVLQILSTCGSDISLAALINSSVEQYAAQGIKEFKDEPRRVLEDVRDLFAGRFRFILAEKKTPPDVIEAVLSKESDVPSKVVALAKATSSIIKLRSFSEAATASVRVVNLSKPELGTKVDPKLLTEKYEQVLFKALQRVSGPLGVAVASGDLKRAVELLASIKGAVDDLFDGVLINAEDRKVRENRLRLLNLAAQAFTSFIDLSKIQSE